MNLKSIKTTATLLATIAAIVAAASTAQAAPKPVDSYCSPTGDYCQGIVRQNGRLRAKLSTFSFTGIYQLCVRTPRVGTDCNLFRLRRDGNGIYQGSIGLSRHFNLRPVGRYTVTWRYSGSRLGKSLHFTKS